MKTRWPRVHHDWELQDEPNSTGERLRHARSTPNGRKVWFCKNCHAEVQPSKEQQARKVFRKPNNRRKIDGEECEIRMVRSIHET